MSNRTSCSFIMLLTMTACESEPVDPAAVTAPPQLPLGTQVVTREELAGIHLMLSGEVVADLRALVKVGPQGPAHLDDLTVAKAAGEHHRLEGLAVIADLSTDVDRMHRELDQAQRSSSPPDAATAQDQLHDLLVRVRLGATDVSGHT